MRKNTFSLAAGLVVLLGLDAHAQSTAGSWSLPSPDGANQVRVGYGGSATDASYLYVIGSYDAPWTDVRRYDPISNAWAVMTSLPEIRRHNACVHLDGKLYSFGGTVYGDAYADIYRFDLGEGLSGTWTKLDVSLNPARFGAAAAVLNGKIYLSGGVTYPTYRTDLVEFDPASTTLQTRASLPVPLVYHATAGFETNGRIYVMGGQNATGYLAGCYEYDPGEDSWSATTSMNVNGTLAPRTGGRAFVLGSRIYFTGGEQLVYGYWSYQSANTLEFSPLGGGWRQRASLGFVRSFHAGGAIDGKGFVFGGDPTYRILERFAPPDLGAAPALSGIRQVRPAGDEIAPGQWTGGLITFEADVADPDSADLVRFDVLVKQVGMPSWNDAVPYSSGWQPQGSLALQVTLPSEGDYEWRFRVSDDDGNTPIVLGQPSGWTDFNPVTPDFRCDTIAPANVTGLSPAGVDIQVPGSAGGYVTFAWTSAMDGGSQVSYEIQVASDESGFGAVERAMTGVLDASVTLPLTTSRFNKFWRVRAVDLAGNTSAWSAPLPFRVVWDDGIGHAAEDATKFCGFGAGSEGPGLAALLLVLVILGKRHR